MVLLLQCIAMVTGGAGACGGGPPSSHNRQLGHLLRFCGVVHNSAFPCLCTFLSCAKLPSVPPNPTQPTLTDNGCTLPQDCPRVISRALGAKFPPLGNISVLGGCISQYIPPLGIQFKAKLICAPFICAQFLCFVLLLLQLLLLLLVLATCSGTLMEATVSCPGYSG